MQNDKKNPALTPYNPHFLTNLNVESCHNCDSADQNYTNRMNCFYLVLLQHLHLSQGPPRVETQRQLAQLGPKQKPLVVDGRWRIVSCLLPSVVQLKLGGGSRSRSPPPHSP